MSPKHVAMEMHTLNPEFEHTVEVGVPLLLHDKEGNFRALAIWVPRDGSESAVGLKSNFSYVRNASPTLDSHAT